MFYGVAELELNPLWYQVSRQRVPSPGGTSWLVLLLPSQNRVVEKPEPKAIDSVGGTEVSEVRGW